MKRWHAFLFAFGVIVAAEFLIGRDGKEGLLIRTSEDYAQVASADEARDSDSSVPDEAEMNSTQAAFYDAPIASDDTKSWFEIDTSDDANQDQARQSADLQTSTPDMRRPHENAAAGVGAGQSIVADQTRANPSLSHAGEAIAPAQTQLMERQAP